MSHRQKLEPHVPERSTRVLKIPFLNEDDGTPALPFEIFATLYSDDSPGKPVINGRNRQDIYNANSGAMNAETAILTLTLDPADTVILDEQRAQERHVLLLEWNWGVGKVGRSEIEMMVVNLHHVPHIPPD
jgi:hypothetical protein